MADLGSIQKVAKLDEQVRDIPVYDRAGQLYLGSDGKPSTVGVVGAESATYKKNKAQADRTLGRSGRVVNADEYRRHYAAGGIVRWSGWEENGKKLECNAANALKVLEFDHILHQVEAGIRRDVDFFDPESVA